MRNVLIVSKSKEHGDALAKLIRPFKFERIDLTDSAQDARRKVQRNEYCLAIINTPLSHEFGTELALDILEKDEADVILIVRSNAVAKAEMSLGNAPILIVDKPIDKGLMLRQLQYILNLQEKRNRLQQQNTKLKKKMEGLKDQFRAKLLLMEKLGMSENEAHRYLQKQAMDQRRSPEGIAKAIINLYSKK